MTTFKIEKVEYALIVGGGHGIGFALAERYVAKYPNGHLFVTYRQEQTAEKLHHLKQAYADRITLVQLDPTNEVQLQQLAAVISETTDVLNLVVNCVGTLHDDQHQPEKSLQQVALESFQHAFTVNTVVTALLAKSLSVLIKSKELSLFASISAKVGSITDNHLGGWYAYRMSKAALNMLIKTLSIEFLNRNFSCIALALHPGTTKTQLSAPFISHSKLKIYEPLQTAEHLLQVIDGKTIEDSGKFFSWDGSEIAW